MGVKMNTSTMRAWQLEALGIENLRQVEQPVPQPGPRRSAGTRGRRVLELSRLGYRGWHLSREARAAAGHGFRRRRPQSSHWVLA